MKKLYSYLFIIFLFSNIAIAQTNNDSSLETLNTNEVYPEATFEWDEELGGVKKVWITWPDGRKESVNSLYSDDNVTNGIDRFYVILENNIEQTVIVKDKEFLELNEEGKKLWKEFEKEKEKMRNGILRDKIIMQVTFFLSISIPIILFYLYCSKRRKK